MFDQAEYRRLVSGKKRGLPATLCRVALQLLAIPYGAAVRVRGWCYDHQWRRAQRVNVPVISIGNVTAGGTGKTPLVAWIARHFREHGLRVAIISRGYGAEAGARNDEALELELLLPDVPHVQNPDRVAGARMAIDELQCEAIVLDDAFQHRRIHRDLDIVLIDALQPFGYGHLLPRGLLREPLSALRRADVVVLSRADLVSQEQRDEIRRRIDRVAPKAMYIEAAHRPQQLVGWPDVRESLDAMKQRPVVAFCGIGNPEGFRQTLQRAGCQLAAFRIFPDHHPYGRKDVAELEQWAREANAQLVLCTLKDLVKIRLAELGDCPLRALEVGIEIVSNRQLLVDRLEPLIQRVLASRGTGAD